MGAVACFFPALIEEVSGAGQVLRQLPSIGELCKIDYEGEPLAAFYPGQGASLAARYALDREGRGVLDRCDCLSVVE